VRGDVHNNSAEGFFNVFKRGMTGVYQHCGYILQRYLIEFEFRHNTRAKLGVNDKERATLALKGAAGKRLTLRQACARVMSNLSWRNSGNAASASPQKCGASASNPSDTAAGSLVVRERRPAL
jgi:hypothetical protein